MYVHSKVTGTEQSGAIKRVVTYIGSMNAQQYIEAYAQDSDLIIAFDFHSFADC